MEAWDKSLAWIRGKLNDQVFETWFSPVALDRIDESSLTLSVPNSFFKEWLSNNYAQLIREALLVETGRELEILFEVSSRNDRPEGAAAAPVALAEAQARQPVNRLNPKYTFDNFVVGSSNQLPHAASMAIADHKGQNFNPLFIYGGVGLGKTHLLHAIGNAMRARDPFINVIYLSAEELMNEFVSSLRNNKMDAFRRKYRKSCDVLLIDDIQFIAGKDAMQDEFFHTFNALYEKSKHIVLTSDKYPQEISDLEERLRSRFQWGLIADIQAPELETRLAILEKKAEDEGIPLPSDVALYLASSVKSNIRELEGSLINLAAHASLENRRIDIAFAQETLKRMIALYQNRLTVESVQQAVCSHFNISMGDIKGARRQRSVSFPRQIAMYLCRKGLNTSYPEIGDRFGGKDHTTALAACRKIEKMVSQDVVIRNKVEALERLLGF